VQFKRFFFFFFNILKGGLKTKEDADQTFANFKKNRGGGKTSHIIP
jgi:hypothetical protein